MWGNVLPLCTFLIMWIPIKKTGFHRVHPPSKDINNYLTFVVCTSALCSLWWEMSASQQAHTLNKILCKHCTLSISADGPHKPSIYMYKLIQKSVSCLHIKKYGGWEKNPPFCHVCSFYKSWSCWRSLRTSCFNLITSCLSLCLSLSYLSLFNFFMFSFLCFHGHERTCLECFLSKVACLCMCFVFIHRKSISEKSISEKETNRLSAKMFTWIWQRM